ncbi:MAG: nuclear transport factor 2 family protein [Gammaproteobacteria bacterium]|nr:nuclear transport factor 2 family protein [Gammaproteobacteria bacterium]MDH5303647.1 nuclear transport factor 2 family protein [Gammaproteobacteria bacterium]MDH5322331.1 nuclear transport factor 2 family protein [Gammaproteobacteria bacterium]
MNVLDTLKFAIAALAVFFFGTAIAQDADSERDDATNVWIVVEAQWEAEESGDENWIDRMLADGFYGWGKDAPAPRSKSSTQMWDRFADQQGNLAAHELYPLEIVIHESTAVVHYLYSSAYRDKEGKVKTESGRYTDVLVRTADGWKFIAWHGGDD